MAWRPVLWQRRPVIHRDLRGPLNRLSFCVVDVETTGLDPGADRIIEVGMIRIDGHGRVLAESSSLVATPRLGASSVHGIGEAELRGAPAFVELAADVRRALCGAVVAGHNVTFDLRFLDVELKRAGMTLSPRPFVCTMALGHLLGLHGPRIGLEQACAQFGIPLEARHRALGDARVTARLLATYAGVAGARGIDLRSLARRGADLACCTSWRHAPCAATPSRAHRSINGGRPIGALGLSHGPDPPLT